MKAEVASTIPIRLRINLWTRSRVTEEPGLGTIVASDWGPNAEEEAPGAVSSLGKLVEGKLKMNTAQRKRAGLC